MMIPVMRRKDYRQGCTRSHLLIERKIRAGPVLKNAELPLRGRKMPESISIHRGFAQAGQ